MQTKKWFSMKEICEYLGLSRDTVIKCIKENGLPAHQIGRLWKFDVQEVDNWIKNKDRS